MKLAIINISKFLKNLCGTKADETFEINNENKTFYTGAYTSFMMIYFAKSNINLEREMVYNLKEKKSEIKLQEINDAYYYKNENYTMKIELLEDEKGDYTDKTKVTVNKKDGTTSSSIEKIAYFDNYDGTIETLSNGCIAFFNTEGFTNGWYDKYGNRIQIGGNYQILDIDNNKIFIIDYENDIYYILNMNGKTILKTNALYPYNDRILIKNKNNKMVICDSELNEISNEYDKIILNFSADLF